MKLGSQWTFRPTTIDASHPLFTPGDTLTITEVLYLFGKKVFVKAVNQSGVDSLCAVKSLKRLSPPAPCSSDRPK